jgi:hypothetical protein
MALEVPEQQISERSPESGALVRVAQLMDEAHRLEKTHEDLQRQFTTLGTELLTARAELSRAGIDVTFSLTPEVMKGMERAAELPQVASAPPPGY